MGAVMSDSYPYTAHMQSNARSPREIVKNTIDVAVDNRSFYEWARGRRDPFGSAASITQSGRGFHAHALQGWRFRLEKSGRRPAFLARTASFLHRKKYQYSGANC
jgi:hypothetical protein